MWGGQLPDVGGGRTEQIIQLKEDMKAVRLWGPARKDVAGGNYQKKGRVVQGLNSPGGDSRGCRENKRFESKRDEEER